MAEEPADTLPPDLRDLAALYAAIPIPRPDPEATAGLLARVLAERHTPAPLHRHQRANIMHLVRIARWRVRHLGATFWLASVLLLALGPLVTPIIKPGSVALLILLAPLTAVLGISFALRTTSVGLREVENSCPTGAVEVAAGVALAIVGLDCLFGILASAGLALTHWAPFAPLLAAWMGPLLLLTGLSLPIALRFGAPRAALVGGGPWLLLGAIAAVQAQPRLGALFTIPEDPSSLALHLAGVAVGLLLHGVLLVRGTALLGTPRYDLRV